MFWLFGWLRYVCVRNRIQMFLAVTQYWKNMNTNSCAHDYVSGFFLIWKDMRVSAWLIFYKFRNLSLFNGTVLCCKYNLWKTTDCVDYIIFAILSNVLKTYWTELLCHKHQSLNLFSPLAIIDKKLQNS